MPRHDGLGGGLEPRRFDPGESNSSDGLGDIRQWSARQRTRRGVQPEELSRGPFGHLIPSPVRESSGHQDRKGVRPPLPEDRDAPSPLAVESAEPTEQWTPRDRARSSIRRACSTSLRRNAMVLDKVQEWVQLTLHPGWESTRQCPASSLRLCAAMVSSPRQTLLPLTSASAGADARMNLAIGV